LSAETTVTSEQWAAFHKRWPRIKPPQRPTGSVADAIAGAIAAQDARVLLLGVTPQLAALGRDLTAIDKNPSMIAMAWPGDSANRRALCADWRAMALAPGSFTSVIGDGSFNCLEYPSGYQAVFARLMAGLCRGARLAVRFFVTPDHCETLAALQAATLAGKVESIYALKWRIAMADCAARGDPHSMPANILAIFEDLFAGREALAGATGWPIEDIATMDDYRGAKDLLSFPTEAQIRAVMPSQFRDARLLPSGSYDLAGRCPILVADLPP